MLAQATYAFELDRAYSRTLCGDATPATALAEARLHAQVALDGILHRRGGGPVPVPTP